ncbi:MAG: hypothetical protein JNL66_13280 [Alphaproteobacteria bacterium]|nr:hypothetical protein [Alphaproteobacteria bacterium]
MKFRILVAAIAAALAGCAQQPGQPAPRSAAAVQQAEVAPDRPGRLWNIEQEDCAHLVGLSDDDRSHAAMFYYGYLAARAGIRVVDTAQLERRIANAMAECAARPAMPIAQSFRAALVPQRVATRPRQ